MGRLSKARPRERHPPASLSNPLDAVAGDFDGDGKVDLAVTRANTVRIYFGY